MALVIAGVTMQSGCVPLEIGNVNGRSLSRASETAVTVRREEGERAVKSVGKHAWNVRCCGAQERAPLTFAPAKCGGSEESGRRCGPRKRDLKVAQLAQGRQEIRGEKGKRCGEARGKSRSEKTSRRRELLSSATQGGCDVTDRQAVIENADKGNGRN